MSRTNKEIIVFIAILTFAIILGLITKTPENMQRSTHDPICGLYIQFKEGVTQPEIKNILENSGMPKNYSLDYNVDSMGSGYYIIIEKDKMKDVMSKLKKEENLTISPDFRKGDSYIIEVTDEAVQDKNFTAILGKNNLQVKKSIWCNISFGKDTKNWISKGNAIGKKRYLEQNENIFFVGFEYMDGA
jgi:hypothetical protein